MKKIAFSLLLFPLLLTPVGAGAAEPKEPSATAAGPIKSCKRLPSGKKLLKLNFKPDSEVRDLINWMTMVSCTEFVTTGVDLRDKRVTVQSGTELLTLDDAYRLFSDALATVGLTVEPGWSEGRKSLRILPKTAP